jgi:hypothetical protein
LRGLPHQLKNPPDSQSGGFFVALFSSLLFTPDAA